MGKNHDQARRFGTRQRYLVDTYVMVKDDLIFFGCETEAREFAEEENLTWHNNSPYRGWTETDGENGNANTYAYYVHSWDEGETDSPMNCETHGDFLSYRLTVDGMEYLLNNYGPSVHALYGYNREADLIADIKRFRNR